MVRLIIREDARAKAVQLKNQIQKVSDKNNLALKVSASPQIFGGGRSWHVLIRGTKPISVLEKIDLTNIAVDIDPLTTV